MLDFSDKKPNQFISKPTYEITNISGLDEGAQSRILEIQSIVDGLRLMGIAASHLKGICITDALLERETNEIHIVVDMNEDLVLRERLTQYDKEQGFKYNNFPHGSDYGRMVYADAFKRRLGDIETEILIDKNAAHIEDLSSVNSDMCGSVIHKIGYDWNDSRVILDFGKHQNMVYRYAAKFRSNESAQDSTNPYNRLYSYGETEAAVALSCDGATLIHAPGYIEYCGLGGIVNSMDEMDVSSDESVLTVFKRSMINSEIPNDKIEEILGSIPELTKLKLT